MKATLWKELRENAKWAALGFIIFSLGLAYAWAKVTDPNEYYNSYQALLSPTILMVTTLGSAIIGGALGLLQIVPEQARDRWAFLVHRPATLCAIFRGKALAGAFLYLLATVPPFLALAWWASRPGNLAAPFDWRMTLGGLSDILCGLIFYFAGLLTGVRKGRWWGSRALAIPAAVYVLLQAAGGREFQETALWSLAYLVLFVIAARTSFVTNGEYKSLRRLGRVSLFLVLLFGTFQLFSWAESLIGFATRHNDYYSGTQYAVLKDGTPVKEINKKGRISKVETLDGKAIEFSVEKLASIYDEVLPQSQIAMRERAWQQSFRSPDRYVRQLGSFGDSLWFYAPGKRLFEEYDRISIKRVGMLTENGLLPGDAPTPAVGFTGVPSPNNVDYLQTACPIFGDSVFSVNILKHTVSRVYAGAGDLKPIRSASLRGDNRSESTKFVCVGMPKQFAIFDTQGKNLITVPFTHDPKVWDQIAVHAMPDGSRFFLFISPDYADQSLAWGKLPTIFEEYDAKGSLIDSRELPGHPFGNLPFRLISIYQGSLYPLYLKIYYDVRGKISLRNDPRGQEIQAGYEKRDAANIRASTLSTIFAGVISAGLALLRMRGQRMAGAPRIIWLATIFMTGFAGLLAFIATRPKIVRIPCPACVTPRLIDRVDCEHCSAPWEKPKKDGTEVFAALKPTPA